MIAEILSKLNPWMEARMLRQELEMERASSSSIIEQQQVFLKAMNTAGLKYEEAFRKIIAEEKPTSNSTVKRMAHIAREAMKL